MSWLHTCSAKIGQCFFIFCSFFFVNAHYRSCYNKEPSSNYSTLQISRDSLLHSQPFNGVWFKWTLNHLYNTWRNPSIRFGCPYHHNHCEIFLPSILGGAKWHHGDDKFQSCTGRRKAVIHPEWNCHNHNHCHPRSPQGSSFFGESASEHQSSLGRKSSKQTKVTFKVPWSVLISVLGLTSM